MIRKLCLALSLLCMTLTASAFKRATDAYAIQAENIVLCVEGVNSDKGKDREKEVVVSILGFKTSTWCISIVGNDDILSGTFTLTNASLDDGVLFFKGQGTNEDTGQFVEFTMLCLDDMISITFDDPYNVDHRKKGNLKMRYDMFMVFKEGSDTFILLNDDHRVDKLSDPGWAIASIEQLKLCLSQNPYIKRN